MTAARLFLPPSSCGLIVDRGDDFPRQFTEKLESLGREMICFRLRAGKTTRALNIYSGTKIGDGHQSFRYLSPQLHLLPRDLLLPPSQFATPHLPEWIHVVCVTERAQMIVADFEKIRDGGLNGCLGAGWKGKIIWEPLGRCCIPEELENIISICRHVEIFSPNLLELQSILSIEPNNPPRPEDVTLATEQFRAQLSRDSPMNLPAVIVRAGELGAYTASDRWTGWVPAFWSSDQQDRVVDPTGGGNAFLGGLMAGLLLSGGDLRAASVYASTAASFAIEQRGLPELSSSVDGEQWNNDSPWTRLQQMAVRVEEHTWEAG